MKRRLFALSFLLAILIVTTIAVLTRRGGQIPADDRIGQICVVPAPGGDPDQALDAGTEIYVYIYLAGADDECVSSSSLTRVPEIDSVGPTRWNVSGGFVDAGSDQPQTPDCGGGLTLATLGHLEAGSYEVESALERLAFEIPSPETRICVSRRRP